MQCLGQPTFDIKFLGISGHVKSSPHPQLFVRKIDKKGYAVLNIGVISAIEYKLVNNWLSVKLAQAILSDCANQIAGFTHIGLRLNYKLQKHSFSIGNGPTIYYRKNWNLLNGYVDEGLFKQKKALQYIFFWYAGEIEYHYHFSEKFELGFSFIPGPPEFFSLAPGIRFNVK